MSKLQALPSLNLGSLRSIKLSNCGSLITLPLFPQSLLKLGIHFCGQIESLNLPNGLEELSCGLCNYLELDLSNLPPQPQNLRINQCPLQNGIIQLDQLPAHLKNLELGIVQKRAICNGWNRCH
jgi:hypothetical protein